MCSTIYSKTQTDQFSSETLKRVESILSGLHSGAFCQIKDIYMSGFGKLNIDSDLLFVRLVYGEKSSVFKKKCFTMLVLLEHHVKSKANHLKITTIYNLSLIK